MNTQLCVTRPLPSRLLARDWQFFFHAISSFWSDFSGGELSVSDYLYCPMNTQLLCDAATALVSACEGLADNLHTLSDSLLTPPLPSDIKFGMSISIFSSNLGILKANIFISICQNSTSSR